MKRRTYIGVVEYQGKEYPGHFTPFITEEQWDEQQLEFKKRSKCTYVTDFYKQIMPYRQIITNQILYCFYYNTL